MVRRRGLSLLELTVALFVMTAAMTAIVQLLAMAARQRRMIEARRVALAEVTNQAEQIVLRDWKEFEPGQARQWDLSANAKTSLPQATATIEVRESQEPLSAKQIRLMIRSSDSTGQSVELADLTVWKYAPGGEP
jgi:Tfp pilus assembly protein PilV